MDLNSILIVQHHEAFVAARLESARYYHEGTGSPVVAMIGGVAAALRRLASSVEAWARGNTEPPVSQRHVSAR